MKEESIEAEFISAYDEYLEALYRYFYFRLNDRERAMDLAQETFMRAWQYVRRGNEIGAMRPFLYATAANLFKNELRGRKPVVSLDALFEDLGFDPEGSTEEEFKEAAEARELMRRIDELSDRDKETLTLRYAEGLPVKEIADLLNEKESAVSVRIHRALRKLRDLHEGTI